MADDELNLMHELRDYEKRFEGDSGVTLAVVDGVVLIVKTLMWMNGRRRHDFIDLGRQLDRLERRRRGDE